MKLSNEILHFSVALSAIAVISPISLTSCGNVYVDLTQGDYEQKFTPLPTSVGPIDNVRATQYYFDALKNPEIGKELIKDDILWSASWLTHYSGEQKKDIDGDIGYLTYTRYVLNVSEYSFEPDSYTNDHFVMSYKISGECETKMTDINDSKSYKITGIQFTWNMQNIVFSVEFHHSVSASYEYRGWMLIPDKYSVSGTHEGFWEELTGNEHIDFNFRSICKGYSENGVQNYGYEETEQAIIDENHKYTPRLDEPLTNFFLFESGYLDNVKSIEED